MKIKPLGIAMILLWATTFACAQKLPNIQQKSLRIPVDMKIDGKATEWNNQLQAHNSATNIFYTLANDDENLYLAVQAINARIIEKILDVGITLTINNAGNKSDKAKENISISYPAINDRYTHSILVNAGDKANWSGLPSYAYQLPTTLTRTDSTVAVANKLFNTNSKNIKVLGCKNLPDTLISIYNEYNIKAVAEFSNNGVYTYELVVPLKFVGISINDHQKFTYNIKLNDWGNAMAAHTYMYHDPVTGKRGDEMDGDPDLNSTTEFWGEYTLAKK